MRIPTPPEPRLRARPVVTGRALVLGAVVILLVVLLASPLHRFLASRSDVSDAARQLRADQQQLTQLTHQQEMWQDPGFIQQQARTRLQFAMPGDIVYVTVDKGAKSDIQRTAGAGTSVKASAKTWNERLWSSVQAAGR